MDIFDDEAVSPVVASILVVAITVALAVGVFVFVMDTSDNQSTSVTAYSSFSADGDSYSSTIGDAGTAEFLTYRLNGEPLVTITTPKDHVGEEIELTRYSQFCAGDELTVVGGTDGDGTVLQTAEIDTDVNCNLSSTSATSQAEFDGNSWIIDTTILNRAEEDNREYIIVLTDGEDYEILETVTVDSGETTTISGTSTTFDDDADVSVGVLSPSAGSSSSGSSGGGSLTSASEGSFGWSGGPSAGHSFYSPYSSDSSYSSSDSTGTSGDTSGSSSLSSATEEETGGLALSSSRVSPGEDVTLYATLATTKEVADETLVVYATRTNPTTEEKARSTYELTANEPRNVTETFSIDNPGEYVITASLVGETDVHSAGTLTVVEPLGVTLDSADVSADVIDAGEAVRVSGDVTNDGSTEATFNVEFFVEGESETIRELTLGPGESTTIEEEVTLSNIGQYQFHIGIPETAAIEKAGDVSAEDPSAVSASVSASPETPYVGDTVEFSATATHEEGVAVEEYRWDFGDGSTEQTTTDTVTHAYSTAGPYDYVVTAVAEDGEMATVDGQVEAINQPSASASASPMSVAVDESVSFSAESSDAYGDVEYVWDFGDGETATGIAPSHSYSSTGDYEVSLTVTDGNGVTATDTVTVSVSNAGPEANIQAGETEVDSDQTIQFDGSGSSDPDGDALTYAWAFGDGDTSSEVSPSHTYESGGTYEVTLTVSDGNGGTATDSMQITVQETVMKDGLVAYWAFDEGSGNTATEEINSYDGSLSGPSWTSTAKQGPSALFFDGTSDSVTTNWAGITGQQPRTWSIWFKSSSSRDHRIISYGRHSNGEKYDIRIDASEGDVLRVENKGGQKYGSTDVADGNWHHLVVVFPDGGTNVQDHRLYVDGERETSTGGGSQSLDTGTRDDVRIGTSHYNTADTHGTLDDIRAYGYAMSDAEVRELYEKTK